MRRLEIGPGKRPISGFETLNIVGRPTYRADASARLPISTDTFDLVYASHVLEHIPWHKTDSTLKEWVRILKPGGILEIWVPNAQIIAAALLADNGIPETWRNNFHGKRHNPDEDVCLWAAGRLYSFGPPDHGWHRSLYTPNYLHKVLCRAGLRDVHRLQTPRGYDHGWINLGMGGTK
jgi:SAM-dependent methyltransferase